ncbi:ABC transporter transmembrane region 2-domain-containing protein [Blastocladiella britannica]|nr:ABC transporter transmembrane region 2-domain-containing protein [Blastocladiella britannica]
MALLVRAIVVTSIAALGKATTSYLVSRLALSIRSVLTTTLHARYISALRPLLASPSPPDNLDQRLAADIDRLSTLVASTLNAVVLSPVTIASYTWQLAQLSGWGSPAVIYAYAMIGAVGTGLLVPRAAAAVARKDRTEGDFRALHAHVAAAREPIVFLASSTIGHGTRPSSAADSERHRLDEHWFSVRGATLRVLAAHFAVQLATELTSYLGSTLNYVVVAIALFGGRYDHMDAAELGGVISQNAFVAIYLVFKLTSLVNLLDQVADMAGHLARVGVVAELPTLKAEVECDDDELTTSFGTTQPDGNICVRDLDIVTSSGQILVKDFNATFRADQWTLITGPSGAGKTSLLRVLAGIWGVPNDHDVDESASEVWSTHAVYLPQRPYLVPGSLLDQLTVGLAASPDIELDRESVWRWLCALGLDRSVLDINDTASHSSPWMRNRPLAFWTGALSPGEQQRLAVVRALVQVRDRRRRWERAHAATVGVVALAPRVWVLVDEGTNAVDRESEAAVWALLREAGVSLVAIAHQRPPPGLFDTEISFGST